MTRLVLAHAGDGPARVLAARWGTAALLVTPAQLVERAWTLHVDRDGSTRVGAGPVPVTAVVNRLGGVGADELPRVRRQDRAYAAAELTAFLRAWLRACRCPVLNPPGAGGGLNGPGWTLEGWLLAAAAAGLPVRAAHRRVRLDADAAPVPSTGVGVEGTADVPVVAGRCIGVEGVGAVDATTAARVGDLARAAGTPLLQVTLDGPGPGAALVAASAWPDVGHPAVATALDAHLDATLATAAAS